MFDSNKIFTSKLANERGNPNEDISIFALHVYASILNESILNNTNQASGTNSLVQQNDNLLRAITPQLIEFLIDFFNEQDDTMLARDTHVAFFDKKLVFCRVLPLIVNVLHSSLPDKRLVDLGLVLDRFMDAFQKCERADIKLEFVKSYLNMLHECTDRAALKIVIVSKKFFALLLKQVESMCKKFASSQSDPKVKETNALAEESKFLHEFVRLVLGLIKSLLENSEAVKVRLYKMKNSKTNRCYTVNGP